MKKYSFILILIIAISLIANAQSSSTGYALSFNGIDNWVEIPETSVLDISDQLTVSIWVKTYENITAKIVEKETWNSGWTIGQDKWDGWKASYHSQNNTTYELEWDDGIPVFDQWYHIAITYDGNYFKLLVDGIVKDSLIATENIKLNNEPISVGADKGTQKFFFGDIDELRIWNIALSQDQILALKNNYINPANLPEGLNSSNLAAYYRFDEDTQEINVYDYTSNGSDGILVNMNPSTDRIISDAFPISLEFETQSSSTGSIAGNALQFTGENCIDYGNIDFGFEDEMSIMAWIRWDTEPVLGNNWTNMISNTSVDHGDSGQFWLQHNSDNSHFEFALSTENSSGGMSRNYMYSTTSPQKGTWYHIAAIYTGEEMQLYVNGTLETSRNKTGNIYPNQESYKFIVAAWADDNNEYRAFTGTMDEISIWNTALDVNKINELMNSTIVDDQDGLVGYWNFNVNNGETIEDNSGNDYDGTNTSLDNGESIASYIASTAPIFETLPVELLGLKAECDDKQGVNIIWTTASEINNDFFTISKSSDGVSWTVIGEIAGAGNSTEILQYFYHDNDASGNLYYKLRQTDFNGNFEEFDIIYISCTKTINSNTLLVLFPNPVETEFNIFVSSWPIIDENAEAQIIDLRGNILYREKMHIQNYSAHKVMQLPTQVPSGYYLIKIQGQTHSEYQKFSKL
jgi:hypothetical protein